MIEFAKWNTPFADDEIHVVSVEWGQGPSEFSWRDPARKFSFNTDNPEDTPALTAHIFDSDREELYLLSFETISGFRMLDEHGLTEIWSTEGYDLAKLGHTFLVRNHSWHKESPITFLSGMAGEWSYLVTGRDDCLEIISRSEPKIIHLGSVSRE